MTTTINLKNKYFYLNSLAISRLLIFKIKFDVHLNTEKLD